MNTSAQALLKEYGAEGLRNMLVNFPHDILYQKGVVRVKREKHEDARLEHDLREAELLSEITCATMPESGKPMFSNETARKAELMKRQQVDAEYRQKFQAMRTAENELGEEQDKLECMADKFKAMRYVVGLMTQELALLASEEYENEGAHLLAYGTDEEWDAYRNKRRNDGTKGSQAF